MSLGLSITLYKKDLKKDFKFKRTLFEEELELSENRACLYYELNWAGVRYENTYLINKYIVENNFKETKIEDIKEDKNYLLAYKNLKKAELQTVESILDAIKAPETFYTGEYNDHYDFRFMTGKEVNENEIINNETLKLFDIEETRIDYNNRKESVTSALNILSLNLWNGANGECLSLIYENKYKTPYVLTKGKLQKVKNEKQLFVYDLGDILPKRKRVLKNELKHVEDILNRVQRGRKLVEMDNTYIGIKSEQIFDIIEYFYKDKNATLYLNFG